MMMMMKDGGFPGGMVRNDLGEDGQKLETKEDRQGCH